MNNKIKHLKVDSKPKRQIADTEEIEESKLSIFIRGLTTNLSTKTQVVVLQHPQERKEDLATLGVLAKCLPQTLVKIGLSWPSLKKILGREIDPTRWGVVYLGTQSESQKFLDFKEVVAMSGKAASLKQLEGIVVLDGSWREAKTLWWRNAWLLKLNRIVLNPQTPALYNKLRREPRRESVSTLEAVAMVVAAIENKPEIYDQLLEPLQLMVSQFQSESSKKNGRGAPRKDWRRRRKGSK